MVVDIKLAQFPHLTQDQYRLDNLLVTCKISLELETQHILIKPVNVAINGLALALHTDAGNAELVVGNLLFNHWLQPWVGLENINNLLPALRCAAYQAALAPLLAALNAAIGVSLSLSATSEINRYTKFGLWLDNAALPSAIIYLDEDATNALISHLKKLPHNTLELERLWPNLWILLTPYIGQLSLSSQEIKDLATCDILLLPSGMDAQQIRVTLRQGQCLLATGALHHQTLCIDQVFANPMSEIVNEQTKHFLDPDTLEVRIDFDLGHLHLPLQELRQLQPGYSFDLNMSNAHPVRIVAGQQVIGYGELVQIDERLGVRVVHLALPSQ